MARIWKPRSDSENDAVAAARVVEGSSRSGLKRGRKRRCLQSACEKHFSMGFRANSGGLLERAFIKRENPNAKLCSGNYYIKKIII